MRRLSPTEIHAKKVAELGLDPTALNLASVEAIAGMLRRSAGFLCPCKAPTLVRDVMRPLRGLVDDVDSIKSLVEDTLDIMIAHGDLLEQGSIERALGDDSVSLLYAAPPGFVLRENGSVILLGIASDQLSALPDDLEMRIEYANHVRRLNPMPGEALGSELARLGLIETKYASWLRSPHLESPEQHLALLNSRLDSAPPSRCIPGLVLLDAERPVQFYRGRWVQPKSHTGRFVARRDQAYGAKLWCYVHLRNGNPERMIDLPLTDKKWRGCDEAWYLQMAIDAMRREPQRYRCRSGPSDSIVLELFSPIPKWAQRRWDAIAEPILASGCLIAYRFTRTDFNEEMRFVRESLWLAEVSEKHVGNHGVIQI